jgi:hypothetical protein
LKSFDEKKNQDKKDENPLALSSSNDIGKIV